MSSMWQTRVRTTGLQPISALPCTLPMASGDASPTDCRCRSHSTDGHSTRPRLICVYGPVSHKNSQPKEYNGVGYLAELHDYDEEVPFKQTVTVTESKVRSVETTRTLVIDWGVESEQKIGGEFAGASFEASIKEHFSVSDSTETKQAEEDSTSTEVSHEIEFNFQPYKDTLLTINTISITTKRPLNGDLVWTGGYAVYVCGSEDISHIRFSISSWELLTDKRNKNAKDEGGGCWTFTWKSIDDFVDTFNGVNVDWPGFVEHGDQVHKYPPRPQRLAEITSDKARTSVVATTETRTFDGSISIVPEDVTGQDPDQVLADHGLDADAVIHGNQVREPDDRARNELHSRRRFPVCPTLQRDDQQIPGVRRGR